MKKAAKTKRESMFEKGRTASFKAEGAVLKEIAQRARKRQIPFSMWMREAAEEKMEREPVAR